MTAATTLGMRHFTPEGRREVVRLARELLARHRRERSRPERPDPHTTRHATVEGAAARIVLEILDGRLAESDLIG